MTRVTELDTLYHAHARRYLRDAGGDRKRALRTVRYELANDFDEGTNAPGKNFLHAVERILVSQTEVD